MMLKSIENCNPRHPPKSSALGQMSENFQVYFIHILFFKTPNKKIYNRAEEFYYDPTLFVLGFFIVYLPKKKMETKKWHTTADSPLMNS